MIELIRLKCTKDYYMNYGGKCYTKGKKYVFIKKGDKYLGFDDEWNSPHWMYTEDIEDNFDLENIEKINVTDFVLG